MVATPAEQLRAALAALPEPTRLEIATEIARDATSPRLIASLERLAHIAKLTKDELAAQVCKGTVPSDIDPSFMDVFVDFYDRAERPSLATAYSEAIRFVSLQRIVCSAPTYGRMATAVPTMSFANRKTPTIGEAA